MATCPIDIQQRCRNATESNLEVISITFFYPTWYSLLLIQELELILTQLQLWLKGC